MNILSDIYGKYKTPGAPSGIVAADKGVNAPPAAALAEAPAPVEPSNPWGYSDAEMDYLAKSGFSRERLEQINSQFDPANYGRPIQQWYEQTTTKPVAPDEKRIQKSKVAASIGDALSSIGQIWAAGRGAYVGPQNPANTAMSKTLSAERDIRDLYARQLARYEDGLYDAGMRDVLRGLGRHVDDRAELSATLGAKQKLDAQQAQWEAEQAQWEAEQAAKAEAVMIAQANKDREHEEKVRVNDANIAQGWARIKAGGASGGKGKSDAIRIQVGGDPGDPGVTQDTFGRPVVNYDLAPEEFNRLYGEMAGNAEFLRNNPQYNPVRETVSTDPSTFGQKQSSLLSHNQQQMIQAVSAYIRYLKILGDRRFYEPTPVAPTWADSTAVTDEDDQYLE